MAGKKKTTFTKLARERKLRERRLDKKAKKDARKQGIQPGQNSEIDESSARMVDESPAPMIGDGRPPTGQ